MIDRLIAGAGAVTDGADRFVRVLVHSITGRTGGRAPSIGLAIVLAGVAIVFLLVGRELDDDAAPLSLEAREVPATTEYGNRRFATVVGAIATAYVELFPDVDLDGEQDPDEPGTSWYYYLVDPVTGRGVTVVSNRPASDVFAYTATGVVVEDRDYVADDLDGFEDELSINHVSLDHERYIDATADAPAATRHELASGLPTPGAEVAISGIRSLNYLTACSADADGDGVCSDDEVDTYDLFVFDPESGKAVTVVTDQSPAFVHDQTFTGVLRHDEGTVSDAVSTDGARPEDVDVTVSPTYVLDDLATPASGVPAIVLGIALAILAAVILVGRLGGYVRFRREGDAGPPSGATDVALGERIPLRVTGDLRTSGGLVHVRDAPADLIRFALDATRSTMIVERRDRPEGVDLGGGSLTGLVRGVVTTFRARRPGIVVVADTGRLVVAFDRPDERDRAVATLTVAAKPADPTDPAATAPPPLGSTKEEVI